MSVLTKLCGVGGVRCEVSESGGKGDILSLNSPTRSGPKTLITAIHRIHPRGNRWLVLETFKKEGNTFILQISIYI